MSLDAITWARHQKVGRGPAKSILMAMADYAQEGFSVCVSLDTLTEWTEQNRKTVIKNVQYLAQHGWIIDTERRTGKTGQIAIYVINVQNGTPVLLGGEGYQKRYRSENGTVRNSKLSTNSSENGTVKESQKRNSTENGTVPDLPGKSTGFSGKESQIFPERVPKTVPVTVVNGNERSVNGKPAAAGSSAETPFEKFWKTWPRSPRKVDKADCRKHWERHGLDAKVHVIVAHVSAMKLTKQWKDGFEPAPATYLHGCRWEDELPPTESEMANASVDAEWWLNGDAVIREGARLGVRPKGDEEPLPSYRVIVAKAAGRGPWIDYVVKHAEKSGSQQFYLWVRQQLGDALLPTDDYAS